MNNDITQTESIDHMLTEKPLKLLFRLGLPAVLMALLDELNSFIDAIFLGKYFGSDAISSMSIVLPVILVMVALSTLFSEGTSLAISRFLGAKNIKKANAYFTNTVIMTIITSALMGILFYFLVPSITGLFNVTDGVRYFANIYLKILSLGMPIFMLVMILAKIIYTEGKNGFLLMTTFIQLILNVLINYVLIVLLRVGVMGAALGTLMAQLLQIMMLVMYIRSDKMILKFNYKLLNFNKEYFREVFTLGFPIFLSMLLLSVTMGIESKVIASFGSAALSVQTITGYVFTISSSIAGGIMGVAVVMLGYSVGAKNMKRFFTILKQSSFVVFIIVSMLNLILVLNSPLVVNMFTDSISVINMIKYPALIYGLTAPFIFTTNVVLYAMQPIGMDKTATILFTLQQVVLFLPLLFLFKRFGMVYALSAQPLSETIGGVVTLILIPLFIKKAKSILQASPNARSLSS